MLAGLRGFVHLGAGHVKRHSQAGEQFAPVTRGGAQNERAGAGWWDARASGVEISVGVAPLEENTAAILRNDTDGFVKVVADRATGEILGVHFAGAGATEAVATAALAMRQELTVDDLADQAAPMPSLAKALEVAARAAGTRRRRT